MGWTKISGDDGIDVTSGVTESFTVSSLGKYAFKKWERTKFPVGGRIFYVHNKDNGAEYHFYDSSNNELTTQTFEGLADAVTYTITGTPTFDKFYVYDNINKVQTSLTWGGYGTAFNITDDAIGGGKGHSNTVLRSLGDTEGTIWYYIKHTMNANSIGGCNDWYIGSASEQYKLRDSQLVNWFSKYKLWSSTEIYNARTTQANCWSYSYWSYAEKNTEQCCVAIRSF